jgi:RIO-like serine/threonine protein kinase
MRLDVAVLRYLTREDWRVLMAIEMGMKVKWQLVFFRPRVCLKLIPGC